MTQHQPLESWLHDRSGAIVWDLDGTLVDSAPDLARALNELLNQYGLRGHLEETVRPMIGCGVSRLVLRGFRASGVHLEGTDLERAVRRFLLIYRSCCTRNTRLREHTRETLLRFYNAGIQQGVCTNKPEYISRAILADLDISGFFSSVVGGDTTPHRKPDPESLQHCLGELGGTAANSVMIGDSATDVGAARAAGVPVIVLPGGYTKQAAESLGADLVVPDLLTLGDLLLNEKEHLKIA